MAIQIRLRTPNGQERLQVEDDTTLSRLVDLIKEKTGIQRLTLKCGFPPQNLDISPDALSKTVTDLRLRNETVVVAPLDPRPVEQESVKQETKPAPPPFVPKGIEPDETVLEWSERGGYMVLRVMPDDNSCMFTAFGGALGISDPSRLLRDQITEHILKHPEKFDKAILGDEPSRYVSRMKQLDTWGGGIELGILSELYDIEISSIDVKSLRVDKFGENKELRCIILYSGIHYDRIAFTMDLAHPVEVDVTRWSTDDDEVVAQAVKLAEKLKNMHYFTDTTDFVIRCEVCRWIGQGMKDASRHEKETGHSQFGEMEIK